MKKIIKSRIFYFILGLLLSGVTVYAVNYAANEISFTTSKNSNVKTVKDALDDLYSKENLLNSEDMEIYKNKTHSNTRSTEHNIGLQNLPKGSYVCSSSYVASSWESSASLYGDAVSVTHLLTGCDSQKIFDEYSLYNSAKTSAASSVYVSAIHNGLKFYCEINNDNTSINVKYSTPSASDKLSVLLENSCIKIG